MKKLAVLGIVLLIGCETPEQEAARLEAEAASAERKRVIGEACQAGDVQACIALEQIAQTEAARAQQVRQAQAAALQQMGQNLQQQSIAQQQILAQQQQATALRQQSFVIPRATTTNCRPQFGGGVSCTTY